MLFRAIVGSRSSLAEKVIYTLLTWEKVVEPLDL